MQQEPRLEEFEGKLFSQDAQLAQVREQLQSLEAKVAKVQLSKLQPKQSITLNRQSDGAERAQSSRAQENLVTYMELMAQTNISVIEQASEPHFIKTKMDALAQNMQAMAFLPEPVVADTLNLFRAAEVPMEPTVLFVY